MGKFIKRGVTSLVVVQAKMYRTAATLLLVCGVARAYPGGSPSCTSSPGHGRNNGAVSAEVTNIGGNNWQVCSFFYMSGNYSSWLRLKMNTKVGLNP